jgi:hypothetical protein
MDWFLLKFAELHISSQQDKIAVDGVPLTPRHWMIIYDAPRQAEILGRPVYLYLLPQQF